MSKSGSLSQKSKNRNDAKTVGRYDHKAVENMWQKIWEESKLNEVDIQTSKKPYYNLMMFPYPSAEGLHVGNMYAFTGSDIYGRFKRMQGYEVFEPIGLDGFGIHSENYALKVGRHPIDHASITQKNFYRQLGAIGCMYDWSRTVETYNPTYYMWTQWLFVQMFKHGLAYRGKAQVNWCPSCKTVLADEQVLQKSQIPNPKSQTNSKSQAQNSKQEITISVCERCGNTVIKKLLEQWFFRITAYAGKLLENSFKLDWSEKIRVAQQRWIGKKEGINIVYKVKDSNAEIVCFTTTPVNFAATFIVISPEHPLALSITRPDNLKNVRTYIEASKKVSPQERIAQGREKTGVFTGSYCINHITKQSIPIWISDFVLMTVGTGAIQGCPGHDMRDFEFAKKFGLPIKRVVVGPEGDTSPIDRPEQVIQAGQPGTMINSEFLNGLPYAQAMERTKDYFEKNGWGKRVVSYHLRDWLISRQRYWGPPIPMIRCESCLAFHKGERQDMPGWYSVPEEQLPVLLPRIEDYKPGDDGVAPLAKHKEFYETKCPGCGGKAVRETDVSDTFLDSSWYFLRYPSVGENQFYDAVRGSLSSAHPSSRLESLRVTRAGGPPRRDPLVGVLGGKPAAGPATSKLRMTVLEKTRRAASNSEQSYSLQPRTHNLPWDREVTRRWLPVDMYTGGAEHSVLHLMYSRFITMALHDWGYIDFDEPFSTFYAHGLVIKDGAKMSKSKGNVVNPDEYIEHYGADALRLYLMFTGPYDQGGDFRDSAMEGMYRWINRLWRLAMTSIEGSHPRGGEVALHPGGEVEVTRALHKLVKKVGEDIEKRRYNTAISSMMEFTNLVQSGSGLKDPQGLTPLSHDELKTFVLLLAPFAPFMAEELWQRAQLRLDNGNLKLDSKVRTSKLENQTSSFQFQDPTSNFQRLTSNVFDSVHLQPWPSYDEKAFVEEKVTIVIQVNGKLRDTIIVQKKLSTVQREVEAAAKASSLVEKHVKGKTVKNVVFVPGKLINLVTV